MDLTIEERILTGLFICSNVSNELLAIKKPGWNEKIGLTLEEKLSLAGIDAEKIFPYKEELSGGIDNESFSRSFLIQPDLFLRIRPGHKEVVLARLDSAGIFYQIIDDDTLSLQNATKLDEIVETDRQVVIQDLSSQDAGEFIHQAIDQSPSPASVWDCCAASGGKSIMAYDINDKIRLTVSDVRESIIHNLRTRFQRAGVKGYTSIIVDLAKHTENIPNAPFDILIADVPCSGSGTWSRTPEQLYYFDKSTIQKYASLQQNIVRSALPFVKKDGLIVYITCSVFRKENEEQLEFMKTELKLEVVRSKVLRGYDRKADTMFAALLRVT